MEILRWLLGADGGERQVVEDADPILQTEEGITLRRMRWESDAEAVCSFQDDVYSSNFPDFRMTAHFMNGFRFDLRKAVASPDHGVFVLEDAGRVVGFLWIVLYVSHWTRERYGYVNNVYVLADYRRRGLGRVLMEQTDRFLQERGVREARLTVTASNSAAVILYEQAGYEVARYEMIKRQAGAS
ncbi:MAG: GNAT family N-acetyltransferase [Armatimonadetes bacterium]|nr:GNAT family N-acetyltransferase [Armatimonadota bacterium]NCQ28381.1 GNAT family N-acetyltransferase [Armatimonadota bacterium]